MRFLFRLDANTRVGLGHFYRCLTLAKALKSTLQAEVTFFTNPLDQNLLETLEKFEIKHTPTTNSDSISAHYDWVVIDHYEKGLDYEKDVTKTGARLLVFEDLLNRQHYCDVLLDPTYNRKHSDYNELLEKEAKLLLGSSYALLRDDFIKLRDAAKKKRQSNNEINRVLIAFGGADTKNMTGFVLEKISSQEHSFNIDIVLGGTAKHLEKIENQVGELSSSLYQLHINTPDVAKLILEADLGIGAGGGMSWERAILGLPTLAIQTAENQRDVLRSLSDEKVLLLTNQEKFMSDFECLCRERESRETFIENSFALCDGLGASRIVTAIKEFES